VSAGGGASCVEPAPAASGAWSQQAGQDTADIAGNGPVRIAQVDRFATEAGVDDLSRGPVAGQLGGHGSSHDLAATGEQRRRPDPPFTS
jgi:hypothetical protein